jgi:hypothetical protein
VKLGGEQVLVVVRARACLYKLGKFGRQNGRRAQSAAVLWDDLKKRGGLFKASRVLPHLLGLLKIKSSICERVSVCCACVLCVVVVCVCVCVCVCVWVGG